MNKINKEFEYEGNDVSILILLDYVNEHIVYGEKTKEDLMFQSLFYWIMLMNLSLIFPPSSITSVSILILLDYVTEHRTIRC